MCKIRYSNFWPTLSHCVMLGLLYTSAPEVAGEVLSSGSIVHNGKKCFQKEANRYFNPSFFKCSFEYSLNQLILIHIALFK